MHISIIERNLPLLTWRECDLSHRIVVPHADFLSNRTKFRRRQLIQARSHNRTSGKRTIWPMIGYAPNASHSLAFLMSETIVADSDAVCADIDQQIKAVLTTDLKLCDRCAVPMPSGQLVSQRQPPHWLRVLLPVGKHAFRKGEALCFLAVLPNLQAGRSRPQPLRGGLRPTLTGRHAPARAGKQSGRGESAWCERPVARPEPLHEVSRTQTDHCSLASGQPVPASTSWRRPIRPGGI